MTKIELGNQAITTTFTAGESIEDQDLVYVSDDDEVMLASDSEVQETVGVSNSDADDGDEVEVVILGRKTVTVDGEVSVGEPAVPASTPGRAVSQATQEIAHTHSMGSHSHVVMETDGEDSDPEAHQGAIAGDGTDQAIVVGVDASDQDAETVNTDEVNPGDTDESSPSVENMQAVGMFVTSASEADETADILVGAKSG